MTNNMQFFRFFLMATVVITAGLISCGDEKSDSIRDAARQNLPAPTNTPAPPPILPPGSQGNAVNTSVKHYICPNNCEGSGGATSGTCPVCGTEYLHNQEYHNATAAPGTQVTPPGGAVPGTVPAPTTPDPAQNAAGVWHYTCSNGCAGGAGTSGNCATCGAALVHNQTYHN